MKKVILTLTGIVLSIFIFAQNEFDALRFSQVYYYGTARSMAMGNAMVALGADPGAIVYNPAAIALMRKSDFSFTPGFKSAQATAEFNGHSQKDFRYSVAVNNFSLIFSNRKSSGAVKYFNFGVTYNRIRDFNQKLWIEGVNDKGSMLDDFMYNANGTYPDNLNPFNTYLAYWTYLLDLADTVNYTYTNPLWIAGGPYYGETQRKMVKQYGNGHSLDISGGVNFNDFVYFGFSFAFIGMNYKYLSEYSEFDFDPAVDLLQFKFNENLRDEINGYAGKLGIIITPVKFIRIGAAIQSPYFLKVKDVYYSSIESSWATPDDLGNTNYLEESPVNTYNYSITTPWRFSGGVGLIIGKILALDVDYEKVDYSVIRMEANDYSFAIENQNIMNSFKATDNIRAGADLSLGAFHLRGGYAYYGSAFERMTPVIVYSAGMGYRTNDFYLDLGVQMTNKAENYWLYVPYTDEPMPTVKYNNVMMAITVGTRF